MKPILADADLAPIAASGPVAAASPSYRAVRDYRMPAKVFHWLTVALVFVMVALGVSATEFGEGPAADFLLSLHKLTGLITVAVVLLRLGYRLTHSPPRPQRQARNRASVHWMLYGIMIVVPLLGWAGASDAGGRDLFFGYSLPPIWPEGAGYDGLLLHLHAYAAFTLLALVALHIGLAMQDYLVAGPPRRR